MMKRTLTIEQAREVAKASNLPGLVERVEAAAVSGWDVLTLLAMQQADGTYDVGVDAPTGVMVAWFLPEYIAERVAVPGGEDAGDLHVTLAYLGDAATFTLEDQRKLIGAVGAAVKKHHNLSGKIGGTGRFVNGEDTDPYWVGVEIPGLAELRATLVDELTLAGISLAGHGAAGEYTPHITVAYLPKDQATPAITYQPTSVGVSQLTICVGPNRFVMELPYEDEWSQGGWAPEIVNKALDTVEEDRYTLGPWYIPDKLDAHGEWTDKHELQKSFWQYIGQEDKAIRKQHDLDVVAGEIRDGVIWPFPITVPLTKADGTVTEHTFPAGTPFLGVHWTDDQAWQDVKDGKLSGYSIGGKSRRMLVDLPTHDGE